MPHHSSTELSCPNFVRTDAENGSNPRRTDRRERVGGPFPAYTVHDRLVILNFEKAGYNYRVRAQDSGSLLFTIDGMLFEDAQTRDMMDATGRPILTLRRRPESDGFKIDGLDSDRAHLYATKPVIKYASFGKHHVDQTWSAQIKVQDRCAPNSTVEGERFYLHLESVRDHTRAEIFDSQRQLVASIEAPLDGEVTMAVVVGADLALMAAIGVIYKDKAILRQHDRQRKWVNGDLCTGRVENCARCRGTKPVSSSVGISHKA